VERIAGGWEKRMRDAGKEVTKRQIEPAESEVVRMRVPPQDSKELRTLLGREAAKAAVEYIGLRASPEIALLPALDPLRDHARLGQRYDGISVLYVGPRPFVRLPRLNQIQVIGGPGRPPDDHRLDAYMDGLVPIPNDGTLPDLGVFPEWPGFEHRLELVARRQEGSFRLTLFTALVITVELHSSMAPILPWSCFDKKDIRARSSKPETYSPWSSGSPTLDG
jgi:hypothetical protein